MRAKHALLGGAALAATGGLVFLLAPGGPADPRLLWISSHEAAATCRGSVVELEFDPEGRIEARAAGRTVASADVPSRRVSYDTCTKAPMPGGFSQRGARYTRLKNRTTITCRFPDGRFGVVVYPVSPSWAGERPAGSNVAVVLRRRLGTGPGPRRTILASATVLKRSGESDVVFAKRYCTASTSR